MAKCVVMQAKDGGYWLRFEYDQHLVERLKLVIPWQCRKWHADMRAWWIAPGWIDHAKQVVAGMFADLDDEERRWNPPPPRSHGPGEDCFAKLYLLPNAPREIVKASYRALALIHHPDTGGDPELFKAIERAYSQASAQAKSLKE